MATHLYKALRDILADLLLLAHEHGGAGQAVACSSLYMFLCQHAEGHTDVEHLLPVFIALQRIIQEEDVTQGPVVVQRLFVLLDSIEAKCQQDFSQGRFDEPALVMQTMAVWMRRLIVDPLFGKTHPHLVAMLLHRMYKYSVLETRTELAAAQAAEKEGSPPPSPHLSPRYSTTTAKKPPRTPPKKKTSSRLRRMASAAKQTTTSATSAAHKANDKLLQGDTATLWRRSYADLPTPPAHTCAALLPVLLAWQHETDTYRARAVAMRRAAARVPPTTNLRVVASSVSDVMSTHHSLATVHEAADEGGYPGQYAIDNQPSSSTSVTSESEDDGGSLVLHRRPTVRMSPREPVQYGGGSSTLSSSPRSSTSSGGLEAGERVVRATLQPMSPLKQVRTVHVVYSSSVAGGHVGSPRAIAGSYEAFKALKSQQTM